VLAALSDDSESGELDYEQFLREQWDQIRLKTSDVGSFDAFWEQVLVEGGHWAEPKVREIALSETADLVMKEVDIPTAESEQRVMLPITTVRHGDGRHTGRSWLNELPDPITTVAWDRPMLISPNTAKQWKCRSGDVLLLETHKGTLKAPVYVQAGTHDTVVAIPVGAASEECIAYNFSSEGHPLHGLAGGIDDRTGARSWTSAAVTFKANVGRVKLARIQGGDRQEKRGIARAVTLKDLQKEQEQPYWRQEAHAHDLYPTHEHPVHDWAMVIDLSACIGCGACAVACQAENNVAVVGRDQCTLGRELSWLRIERFLDKGTLVFLPMLCQHCEHAPCETVCPVYASLHSSEGLNQQVYNRCVGTRYCANNCPYKVRRFNWYTYKAKPPLEKQYNPDVYVRSRGIMEKCTFCVQRIREYAHIAKDEGRKLRDGEIRPACEQSCPTRAFAFGDLNDPDSRVSALMNDRRAYAIFAELNTQPSVVYLKRVMHDDATKIDRL